MQVLHVVGIDPGLVHTGCVRLELFPNMRRIVVDHHVVNGIDALAVADWADRSDGPRIFIEKYEPRRKYGTDERMVKGEAELKAELPQAVLLSNTGVKQLVTPSLLQALGMWRFPATHHQDLRSAARIALLGALKDPGGNAVVASAVRDHIDGRPWSHG